MGPGGEQGGLQEHRHKRGTLHVVCYEADVVWRVEQHLNITGDSVLQMRGWVQPASAQDARAAQLGLEAGRGLARARRQLG